MDQQHARLFCAMARYDAGDPMRIQHLQKVHHFAAVIARLEGVEDDTRFILETAAIVHDIGIHVSEAKYGSSSGHYQELEGPAEARSLLTEVGGYTEKQIERVCYLVGHHHTYTHIDGIDYQILVEADFLVNIYEDRLPSHTVATVKQKIFKTATGKQLLDQLYGKVYRVGQ